MSKIRIGIVGYGNIGRGVELAIERNEDMELAAVVTRRHPDSVEVLTEGVEKVRLDFLVFGFFSTSAELLPSRWSGKMW